MTSIRMLITMSFLTLTADCVLAQQPSPTPVAPPANENESKRENIVDTTLHSAIMNEDRRVIVHLPRNYSKDTGGKYPVMYVLDGTSQDQHTFDKMTVLSDAGLIPSAIVVGLPNTRGNRERDQTPPFMRRDVNDQNSLFGVGDKFLAFIEKELIPFVERTYRTSGYRAISGNSRGGLFVLYSLIERPDLFQARFCYSTPVWRFDNLLVHKTNEFLHSAAGLKGFLYLSVGEKETEQMVGGFKEMVKVLDKNRRKQFRWAAEYTPFADHQDNALVSTARGLAEWGKYLKEEKNSSRPK